MPDWSQLPDDILLSIFKKLRNLFDCVKFRGICRSWRSCTLRKTNRLVGLFPGILVSNYDRDRSTKHRFLPVSHANLYAKHPHMHHRLPLLSMPQDPAAILAPMRDHDTLIIGSSEGWLVVVEPPSSVYLTNPVTGAKVSLPSIKSTPGWSETAFSDGRRFYGSRHPWVHSVQKAVLSGSPSTCTEASPCYVMILFSMWRKVPFCKIGDKAWNCVDIPDNDVERETETELFLWLSDAIYCKGLFYIVSGNFGKLYAFDSHCSLPKLSEIVGFPPQNLQDWREGDWEYHLAELEGQLLLIFRDISESNYYGTPIETFKFEVYKLDMQHNNWVITKSLGQYALFVGRHQSFYMSELDVQGIKANRIYYLYPWCNSGLEIFRLEHSRIEPLSFNLQPRSRRSFWFTPVLWDLKEKDPKRRPYVKPSVARKEPAVKPMHPKITISNKFCALIDNDDDQSDENNCDDGSALSVTIAEMESESHLNEEINDLSLNAAIRVDRQEVRDSSSDKRSASTEKQTTITEAKEFLRDSNSKLEMRLKNMGDEVIYKHRVTSAADDQSNGTEDFRSAISKKKNSKKSKKNKKK